MGWNTVIVIMNDRLSDIAKDPAFGKAVESACLQVSIPRELRTDADGRFVAIAHSHADYPMLVLAGWNGGQLLGTGCGNPRELETQLSAVRSWANKHGYELRRAPKRRGVER